ncbi:abnormal spindle-like microcephaly-associated protein homolog [Pollicipes pollicipes]|uniref:abnormal spindle-like microcephaly-associated protein homolog n=1 Tax=Pollicipes pollicipes TaxID=41117 RepID=UPI001884B0B9|nr:abnormal spindle-like microcephaly-associated protein homolog [Pollicipes pollicipes]
MGRLLLALQHLETTTRLSAACSRLVAQEHAVPVLYTLIRQCNRSVPHITAVELCLSVLLNLARHPDTADAVHQVDNWLMTLLDKMAVFREKGPGIVTRAGSLLVSIVQSPSLAQMVRDDAKAVQQLRSLRALMVRRQQPQQRSTGFEDIAKVLVELQMLVVLEVLVVMEVLVVLDILIILEVLVVMEVLVVVETLMVLDDMEALEVLVMQEVLMALVVVLVV